MEEQRLLVRNELLAQEVGKLDIGSVRLDEANLLVRHQPLKRGEIVVTYEEFRWENCGSSRIAIYGLGSRRFLMVLNVCLTGICCVLI